MPMSCFLLCNKVFLLHCFFSFHIVFDFIVVLQNIGTEMRAAWRKIDRYSKEIRSIDSKELTTISAVNEFVSVTKEQIASLEKQRQHCYNKMRRCKEPSVSALRPVIFLVVVKQPLNLTFFETIYFGFIDFWNVLNSGAVFQKSHNKTSRTLYYAEKKGEPTKYNLMREAIDKALSISCSPKEFIYVLKKQGYIVNLNPDLSESDKSLNL